MTKSVSDVLRLPVLCLSALCLLAPGCSHLIEPNGIAPIRRHTEPEFGGQYLLYRPSSYVREQSWPLVVVCHSSFPDSPDDEIGDWASLAERHGFILVVPRLEPAKRSPFRRSDSRLASFEVNERHILGTIRHVRAGHSISNDRVMIHGWYRGAGPALYTGLRHPGLFRAVSVMRPRLDGDSLPGLWTHMDHSQPVYVNYNVADVITGRHSRSCVEWLRSVGANLNTDTLGKARRGDGDRAVEFFQHVIRKEPWLHIRAFAESADQPLEIHFKVQSSIDPTGFRWDFGDGDESLVAAPIHSYDAPGTYRVTVTVRDKDGSGVARSSELTVPDLRIRPVRAETVSTR